MTDNASLSVRATMERVALSDGRNRLRRRIAVAALIGTAAVFLAAWNIRGTADSINYQTRTVEFGELVMTVTATGNLEATNQVSVGSELSGIITSMTADFNDAVKIHQPLAYLDDAKYKAAVMKSKAEVAAAEANYRQALATRKADEKKLRRYKLTRDLTQGKMPSMEDLEDAQADLECSTAAEAAAAAAIEKARAALKADEADLKKTVIYAPISGIVLSREVEPGQTVAASLSAPVLYTLAEDLRRMELQVDVDEADVGLVKAGQPAVFTVDAYPDRTFQAQITQVRFGAETTDGVVTYKTVLQVENPDLLLRPGMTATATIIVQKVEKTLLVPNTALRFMPPKADDGQKKSRGLLNALMPLPPPPGSRKKNSGAASSGTEKSQPCVWVLRDNRLVPVRVEEGPTDGTQTAVRSQDLKEGTPLIVNMVTAGG